MAMILDADVIIQDEQGAFDLQTLAVLPARKSLSKSPPLPWPNCGMGWNGPLGRTEPDASSISEPFWLNSPSFLTRKKTAYEHARIWAELEASGKMIGYYDLIVAATALQRGSAVVTFNKRHFSQVKGLTVVEPK